MKYLKDNKGMLLKYLSIIVSNILLYILISFYFRSFENNFLILFILNVIFDELINHYKGIIRFNYSLDFISSIIVGIVLNFIIKNDVVYSIILFCLILSNNIVFMRSRKNDKILGKLFQSLIFLFIVFISMIVCLFIRVI